LEIAQKPKANSAEDLTDWARREADITIPPELRDERWTYQATASLNGKTYKNLGLETVGGGRKK